jgi:hypothetical protein
MDLHHPLFESLALPLLLSFAATGGLRALLQAAGLGSENARRWAGAGVAPGIIVASAWVVGWRLWPVTLTDELPWIYAAAALLGIGLQGMRAQPRTTWLASCVLWALVLAGLSDQPLPWQAVTWAVGAVAIGAVLALPIDSANAAASLVVAALGLAAVAFVSGSALLFELGLSIAAALGGCALWLWPRARICFGACGAVLAVIAWLTLAQTVALLTPVRPAVLLLLAGALLAGPMVHGLRRGRSHPMVDPLIVALVAALWVAAALALALRDAQQLPAGQDDPYYTPRW